MTNLDDKAVMDLFGEEYQKILSLPPGQREFIVAVRDNTDSFVKVAEEVLRKRGGHVERQLRKIKVVALVADKDGILEIAKRSSDVAKHIRLSGIMTATQA